MKIKSSMNLSEVIEKWYEFGDCPVNDNDEIEEDFYQFESGTERFVIWHFFEASCPDFQCADAISGKYQD